MMMIYDILFILQCQVSTTVMDLVVVFILFVFIHGFISPQNGSKKTEQKQDLTKLN